MSQKLLVLYHKNCDDGFGAAWAIHRAEIIGHLKTFWPDGVEYVGGVYGFPPPDCKDRDVVLVDFCYPPQVMEELVAVAKTVLVLDHHISAQKDMLVLAEKKGWVQFEEMGRHGLVTHITDGTNPSRLSFEFDMKRSGASMAWDHFMGGSTRPTLIQYVQDRDLWTKKLPYIDEFTMALRSYQMDFDIWDKLHQMLVDVPTGFATLIAEGESILRYQRQLVDQAVKNSFWVRLDAGYGDKYSELSEEHRRSLVSVGGLNFRIRAACVQGALASEVGEALAERFGGVGLTWSEGKDLLNYSLRSRGDNAPDVSMIAKAFGGGGHAKASGFKSSVPVHVKEAKA